MTLYLVVGSIFDLELDDLNTQGRVFAKRSKTKKEGAWLQWVNKEERVW